MKAPRLAALLGLAVLLAVAAPGAHALFTQKTVTGNMDADPALEQVEAVRVPSPIDPTDDTLAQTAVDVLDTCPTGQTDQRIAGPEEALVTLKLVDADTRPGKEAFIDMRAGAAGRHGELRLVSLRPAPAGSTVCALPHDDFRYLSTRPTRHPRGAAELSDFELTIKDFSRRFKGKELRLLEGWAKPTDALCCPSFDKTTFYRYDTKKDRYVRYASQLKRNRQR
ncbi:MAG TPA: hypothetical protein VGI67_14930 [Thermoleophilaceae bacterium]